MTEKNNDYTESYGEAPRRPTRAPGSRSTAPRSAEPSRSARSGDDARSAREARAQARAAQRREAEEEKAWLAERKRREQAAKEAARARKRRRRQAKFLRFLKGVRNTLIVLLILAVVLGVGAAYLGYRVTNSKTTFPNLYLEGIAVGGLTEQEVLDKLNSQDWDANAAIPLTVQLPVGSSFTVDRLRAGSEIPAAEMAAAAMQYGHTTSSTLSWFDNLRTYIQCYLHSQEVGKRVITLDEDYIRSSAEEGVAAFKAAHPASDYVIDKEQEVLRMVKGAGQLDVNTETLAEEIKAALLSGETNLAHTQIDNELPVPDFLSIYNELAVEPQDAYYVEGGWDVVDEVVGCSFDLDQAVQLWAQAQPYQEVVIPLSITYPEVTGEELRSVLFRDRLGSQTTFYTSSSDNRINNINLAASKLDGLVLMPGDVFSYNDTIGQRTEEAGFLEAGAYQDGQVVEEIGGGICQVSSTLYMATMYANLETVSRTEHYFRVAYLEQFGLGYDATVSWPKPDFKFANNRDYPIKIVAYCDNEERSLTIEIWGTDVDGSYVVLDYDQYVVFDDTYTWVQVGWASQSWRLIYDKDGNFLEQKKEAYSIYHMHDEDIEWPPNAFSEDE